MQKNIELKNIGKDDRIPTELSIAPISLREIDTAKSSFQAKWFMAWTFVWPESADWKEFDDQKGRKYFDVINDARILESAPVPSFTVSNGIEVERKSHKFYNGKLSEYLVFHDKSKPVNSVTYECRFEGTFAHTFDLHKFPFDQHELKVRFKLWRNQNNDARRDYVQRSIVHVSDPANFVFPEWDVDVGLIRLIPPIIDAHECEVVFHVLRKPWFYTFSTTISNATIVLLALAMHFATDPLEERASRISHMATLLLAAIAVKFVVADNIPFVSYATVLDIEVCSVVLYILALTGLDVYTHSNSDNVSMAVSAGGACVCILSMVYNPVLYLFKHWNYGRTLKNAA